MTKAKKLTHVDARGEASMVDVSHKPVVLREAVARGEIRLAKATLQLIESNQVAKGNVLATARIAGIQAAKRCGELIPLCHPLPITHCEVNFELPPSRDRIVITASAKIAAQTGIEMDLLFRTDEYVLADTTGSRLTQLATTLASLPDVYIQLDGFADERGDAVYNQELSTRRADHVRDVLTTAGVMASRIKVAAHGESPAIDASIDSYALDRRVSLTLYVEDSASLASNPD